MKKTFEEKLKEAKKEDEELREMLIQSQVPERTPYTPTGKGKSPKEIRAELERSVGEVTFHQDLVRAAKNLSIDEIEEVQ